MSCATILSGRTSSSASTAASSSSSASPSCEASPIRRRKIVAEEGAEGFATEYRCDLAAHDADDADTLGGCRTSPRLDSNATGHASLAGLFFRSTFHEFVEEKPAEGQMRQIKSLPNNSATSWERAPKPATVLELAGILDVKPLLGSPEMPTVGSTQHHLGECRPCAFFWKPGSCWNGVDCMHCHLCDRGAKKRSQKERKTLLKTQNQEGAANQ